VKQLELSLLTKIRSSSRYLIAFGILISIPLATFFENAIELQVLLALIALTVGIPHGAVDHIVTVPKFQPLRMALFLAAYLAVVGLAIAAILWQNLVGFQLIVLLSAIHFGIGDASFVAEVDSRAGGSKFPKLSYALAAGFMPVMLPLTSPLTSQALTEVNPALIGWAGDFTDAIFWFFVGFGLLAMLLQLLARRFDNAIDLGLLLGLSLIAPPLVAFAFYFGFWHAFRHTGRLTLELGKSQQSFAEGKPLAAFWESVSAGLPALALVLGFTIWLGMTQGFDLSQQLLWLLLVVIWALTVPHMALTARLDYRALVKT
jgi:Brp/Blh family beta-carotene 15,15'-monooxygenase